jgi:threonine aldolase
MNRTDVIELRSDTMTRPTPGMREAIARAEVGDDVFGEDPSVNKLEAMVAERLGKEAAMFVPSGTMGNQTAIRAHTEPGQEIIGDIDSHFFHYETAGPAALAGCSSRLVHGERGVFTAEQVRAVVRDPDNPHLPQSRLIVIENTHNRGAGAVWPVERVAEIRAVADQYGLAVHMDGARLMNACVATGRKPTEYTQYVDTVSTCFSKGLGAPVGSAVAGSARMIQRTRRFRKMFGGAMRQAGVLAAAALYALENHVDRLAEDHANARKIAKALAEMPGIVIDQATVETNLIFFEVEAPWSSSDAFVAKLREVGVLCLSTDPKRVRMVTSLEATGRAIDDAIERIGSVAAAPVGA